MRPEGGGLFVGVSGLEGLRPVAEERIVLRRVGRGDDEEVVLELQLRVHDARSPAGEVGVDHRPDAMGRRGSGHGEEGDGGHCDEQGAEQGAEHAARQVWHGVLSVAQGGPPS